MATQATRRVLTAIGISIGVAALHFLLFSRIELTSRITERYELGFFDTWISLRPERPKPEEVVIVAMDEDSYKFVDVELNKAFPRRFQAQLIERLAHLGAKRVVFDVLFLGESDDKQADIQLAEAMKRIPVVIGADHTETDDTLGKTFSPLFPLEAFRQNAEQLGFVGFNEDFGRVRRFRTDIPDYFNDIPSLAQAAAFGKNSQFSPPGPRDLIDFYGPPGNIKTIPAYQFLDTDIPPQTQDALRRKVKGKIIFVGFVLRSELGSAQKDNYLTSISSAARMFGVEIHANACINLLRQAWISRSSESNEGAALALAAFSFTLIVLLLRPLAAALACLFIVFVWATTAYSCAINGAFLPGAFLTTIFLPLVFLLGTLYSYLETKLAETRFRRAFSLYISPDMAMRLSRDRHRLKLGGEKVVATALFTDIEGFTSLSEDRSAEEVAELLNAYFTEVMDVIFLNQGTLIKFIGDAVFALWGAPVKIEDHAARAAQTALAISEGVTRFNASGRFTPLHTRIGVHTGPLVVGNLGSARRFDFTAVGDTVNLASRVEGLNKYFGTTILLTEASVKAANTSLPTLYIGKLAVAGKKHAIGLYTFISSSLANDERLLFEQGIESFTLKDWETAKRKLTALCERNCALSKAAEFYLGQIQLLANSSLPEDWAGELSLSSK